MSIEICRDCNVRIDTCFSDTFQIIDDAGTIVPVCEKCFDKHWEEQYAIAEEPFTCQHCGAIEPSTIKYANCPTTVIVCGECNQIISFEEWS